MRLLILLFFLLVLPVSPLLNTLDNSQNPLVGFCWASPPFSDMTFFEEGFYTAHHLGCQIEHRQYNWNEIEIKKLVYDWNTLDQWYTTCLKYDITPSLAICPVNSNSVQRNLPQDLEGKPFDDPEVISRLQAFTTLLVNRYPDIPYVSFGNEINYYLRGHPEDLLPYLRMCLSMYEYTQENYPHIQCLVIFGFTGMEEKEKEMIVQFLPACDLLGISTYHACVSLESMTPPRLTEEEMLNTLEYCISLCQGKRFALVETCAFSYPDPGYQATYVHVFFETIRKHKDDMEFACWFTTYDWRPGALTMFSPFLEQFNSAGLLASDGTFKASYYVWIEEMSHDGAQLPSPLLSVVALVIIISVLRIRE